MVLTRNADHRPSNSTASTIRILRVFLDYKIRHQSDSLWIKSVYHGTESLSYLGPKNPVLFPAQLKNAESPEAFKYGIRRWKPKEYCCRLCKTYIHQVGSTIKNPVKAFNGFKNKQQVYEVNVYIFWKFIQYMLRQNTNVKKNSYGQNKRYKKCSFFFHKLQLFTVLLLIPNSYTSWSTRFISLKLSVGFSIFGSV